MVTCLSVGAGLATVIELPDGQVILYDAGTSSPYDVGRNTVIPYLRSRGITHIQEIILSHPNLDHFSGVPTILDELSTGPVVVNPYFETQSTPKSPSRHLLNLLNERGHPVQTLDVSRTTWALGGVKFELLWPQEGFDETFSVNDTSTVLRLTYAGHSILLTGDIEDRSQRSPLRRGDLAADVLVLPHHGSVRMSTAEFFRAVGADVLIRSTHERLQDTYNGLPQIAGIVPLYNTADVGAVRVILDHNGVHVSSARTVTPTPPVGKSEG